MNLIGFTLPLANMGPVRIQWDSPCSPRRRPPTLHFQGYNETCLGGKPTRIAFPGKSSVVRPWMTQTGIRGLPQPHDLKESLTFTSRTLLLYLRQAIRDVI